MSFRALCLLVVIILPAGCSRASEPTLAQATITLVDCEVPGLAGRPARCGSYLVWENREARAGRQIAINFVVLPATAGPVEKDPVFYFDGGPGAGAVGAAPNISRLLRDVHRTRDLVFIDVRGTGRSGALRCPPPAAGAPVQEYFDGFLPEAFVRRCLDAQQADVRFYTQPFAMDDVNDIRAALGYAQINLFGASGGTRQEQIYMRRHGATVRSAVMHGVQPMDAEMPLAFSRAFDAGIQGLLDACRAQPPCRAAYPNLADDWAAIARRFDEGPVDARVAHPQTGRRETVRITRGVYADGLRHMLYNLAAARDLPGQIHDAARGNFDAFAERELAQSIRYANVLAHGMFMSATCAEDVRFIAEEDIRRATAGTFLGDYRVRRQQAACRIWPRGEGVDDGFQRPVTLNVPVLVVSGALDVATPPQDGERVARHLPRARHVIFPNQGHDWSNPGCGSALIAQFIASPGADLDTTCVATTERPPFAVPGPR